MSTDRAHDVVVYGATSFVGQIMCRYLVERFGTGDEASLRWAIAGRDADKLADVAASTGADVPQLVADAGDRAALDELCASTAVVASTVGPYARYGSTLIDAVVEQGIRYCDLTGEPQWMQRMIDAHQARAESTGAVVVHTCGFDSVPSDLGVMYLQQEAIERFGEPASAVRMAVKGARGGFSGGTAASMLNMLEEQAADPQVRAVLANPYALAPLGERTGPSQPEVTWPEYDEEFRSWLAAFVMAVINVRVVLRSHALLGKPWGHDFTYGEAMMTGDGPTGRATATAMSATMAGVMAAGRFGPVRSMFERLMPAPGAGPSESAQEAGYFDVRFHGRIESTTTHHLGVTVTGDRDPGYGSTAKMFVEAAAELVDADVGGGFWTPSTALGRPYLDRLVEHAGLTFAVN